MAICYHCNKEIFFSDEYVSKSGNKIPLEISNDGSLQLHRCPNNRYSKQQTRGQWVRFQQFKAGWL